MSYGKMLRLVRSLFLTEQEGNGPVASAGDMALKIANTTQNFVGPYPPGTYRVSKLCRPLPPGTRNCRGVRTKDPTKFCCMGSCITILSNLVYQELNLCLESLASQFERSILLLGASNWQNKNEPPKRWHKMECRSACRYAPADKQEGNSLGDLRLWEGQVAPSVQMAGIQYSSSSGSCSIAVVVVVVVVYKCHYLLRQIWRGGVSSGQVSLPPLPNLALNSKVSRAETLAIHRPDGFAAGKKGGQKSSMKSDNVVF